MRAVAATYHVPADYPTIQAAINAAAAGDTILVGPGTYSETLDTQNKSLTLVGLAGAEQTIVDAGYAGSGLKLYPGGYVDGFTFRHGQSYSGAGVRIGGPGPTVFTQNIVTANVAGTPDNGAGGGIYVSPNVSEATIRDNVITDNYAGDEGGGIYDASGIRLGGVIITLNRIQRNGCHVGGGGLSLLSAACTYNLIDDNWSDSFAGGVFCKGATVLNNTVVRNVTHNAFSNGCGIYVQFGDARGNIVAYNHGPAGAGSGIGIAVSGALFPATLACNDSWGNDGGEYAIGHADTTGQHNISADPLFCDPRSDDFRLAQSSPCGQGKTVGCELIGAFPVDPGCVRTATRRITWGMLKQRYRR